MIKTIEEAKSKLWNAICQRDGNYVELIEETTLEDLVKAASERAIPFIISVDLKLTGWDKVNPVHTKLVNLINYLQLHGVFPNSIENHEFEFTYEGSDAPFTDHENNVFSGFICSIQLGDKTHPISVDGYWPDVTLIHSIRELDSGEEWTEL